MVFSNKSWGTSRYWVLVKIRTVTWAKAKWPNEYSSVLGTYLLHNSVSAAKKGQSGCKGVKWEAPIQGN